MHLIFCFSPVHNNNSRAEIKRSIFLLNVVILTVKAIIVRTAVYMATSNMMVRTVKMKTAVQSIAPVPQHLQTRKKENTVIVATVNSLVMVE